MIRVIGEIFVPGIIIAMSPMPIIAVIITLLSPHTVRGGSAFAAGWALGLSIVGVIILVFADLANIQHNSTRQFRETAIIRLLLGVTLIGLALKQWRDRPQIGDDPVLPRWMRSFEKLPVPGIVGAGALLSGVNPKTVLFALVALTSIVESPLTTTGKFIALVIFIALASSTVAGLVIWSLVVGDRANIKLRRLHSWLARNNSVMMSLLLFIIGVFQIGWAITNFSR